MTGPGDEQAKVPLRFQKSLWQIDLMEDDMTFKNPGPAMRFGILAPLVLIVVSVVVLFLVMNNMQVSPDPGNGNLTIATASPTNIWNDLLEMTPHPYLTPLPDPVHGPFDGLYAKIDQSWPQWWKCLRCADYRLAGGIWRLQFDKNVMRIFYEVTGWRTVASFATSDDRLYIFNDPYCPYDVGEYKWRMEGGKLGLEVVDDSCAFDLRAENLTHQFWSSCVSAQSDSSLQNPPGCNDKVAAPAPVAQPDLPVSVAVYGGDSRFFARPPDVAAIANTEDSAPPEGITITFDDHTIPYGIHRILWWNGNWIETSTDLPFTAMGVQFFGEQQIGWARVLFDGTEVWRGNTSEIWSKYGRHGGYVEISDFNPGTHSLRVESLGFDYRPVTVVSFGFSYDGGVETGQP
jgi:hypothetical protein